MKIFILGLPGSGKTYLGQQVATSLHTSFVDLDVEIERVERLTIPEIFEKMKEDHFRKVESAILRRWCLSTHDIVMATGGGTPCYFGNMDIINQSGISIFLDVPSDLIAHRLQQTDLTQRPLFARIPAESMKEHIEFMRSGRLEFYGQAHFTSSGEGIKDIVDYVKKRNLA